MAVTAHWSIACDIDPDAVVATMCRVAHHQVDVEVRDDLYQVNATLDLIIVADV